LAKGNGFILVPECLPGIVPVYSKVVIYKKGVGLGSKPLTTDMVHGTACATAFIQKHPQWRGAMVMVVLIPTATGQ
jgi:hypothetical protein